MKTAENAPTLVIGVGASAGGLDAFKQFLGALPDDTGMCFLLVQHLDPTHESLLGELLARCTAMRVCDADQGVSLEANTVYIIRPDTALAVRDGKIVLSGPTLHRGVRLPVDHLFRSLAREYQARSVGIVLSGAGSDGSSGIRDIQAAGGLTVAQKPDTSGQSGMPRSAIDTGCVDLVLEIEAIPAALRRFESLPPEVRQGSEEERADGREQKFRRLTEQDFGSLAAVLQTQADFDPRVYKPATVERRVFRRLTLSGFDAVEPYLEYLRVDSVEQQTLVRDLLINVTDFFRDPEAYAALRQLVIEPLVSEAAAGETLRVWVAACATGEEAYSLAMEFLEVIDAESARVELQLFATDIDQDALSFARAGIYPPSIADHVSQQRLAKYFKPLDGKGYQVRPTLRDLVSFAAHDLTKDPPFSRMHLVSCRNVLIYLRSEVQKHVLKVLHFALQANGHLFLSTSETTGAQRELFSTISQKYRVYRKTGASRPLTVARSRSRPQLERHGGGSNTATEFQRRQTSKEDDLARRAVVEAFAPSTLVVSADGTVIFAHGNLDPFVQIPQGDYPRFEFSKILRPEIATRARGAIYKCRRDNQSVSAVCNQDDRNQKTRIQALPAPTLGDDAVILSFEILRPEQHVTRELTHAEQPESSEQKVVVDQLENELRATREDLSNTVEELETSNEELRSSNEESMSMNEELQSANEELEATTEELRSLNEELTTVNSQLREKVDLLEQAHDDLNNFFASTKIATLFLDERICIKRFTPAAQKLLNIDHADIGRFVGDIARELLQDELEREAQEVLEHLTPRTRDLRTRAGRWMTRGVLPYRTESRRIEGVVVTFTDVTETKLATEKLAMRERQQSVIARIGMRALRTVDLQGFMDQAVREVQQTLATDFCKILECQPGGQTLLLRSGVGWRSGLVGTAQIEGGTDSQAGYTLHTSEPVIVSNLGEEKRFSGPAMLTDHQIVSGISCVIGDGKHPYGVLGAHTQQLRNFSLEDAYFLQAVASVIGSAVERSQARTRLALELQTAHVLAESNDLDDAFPNLLQKMMTELSASVGEVWWFEPDDQRLERRLLQVQPMTDHARVEGQLEKRIFQPGEGMVGRVYTTATATWCSDLGDPALFSRRESAKSLGLASGLALPILCGDSVVGVIALFSVNRFVADDTFLRSLESMGRSIGEFSRRMESEQRARRLAAITESSHDAILSYRLDGTVTEWLSGAERLLGFSGDEMVGRNIDQVVPEELRQQLWEINKRIEQGEVIDPFETQRLGNDGRTIEVSVRSSPVKDSHGNVIGISSTDRDITRQKETERQLLEADRQKDEFLAMLGHELRNPLAAIRSAAELLRRTGADGDELAEVQAVLERQSSHMAGLLDGLLDVSRIIQGKVVIKSTVVDLAAICREVLSDATSRLRGRTLEVATDLPDGPIQVEGDPVRLTQIIDNLISNALKFTLDGGAVRVALDHDENDALLNVSDTGVGIQADLLPHIFEVFRQSEQSLDRSSGGLGLGLALVKLLVEAHGGTVEVSSGGKDQGATFMVRIPITTKKATQVETIDRGVIGPLTLLLIEDDRAVVRMLSLILKRSGHQILVANTGQAGIDLARKQLPDVVLCDIGLPDGLSGFDVAKTLRDDPQMEHVKLVALTGYGRPEDKMRGKEAGFDDYLTKPVSVAVLTRLLRQLCPDKLIETQND